MQNSECGMRTKILLTRTADATAHANRSDMARTRSVRSSDVGRRTTSRLHEPRRARSACLEGGPERSSGGGIANPSTRRRRGREWEPKAGTKAAPTPINRSVRSNDVSRRTTSRLPEPRRARSACLEGGPKRSLGGATVFRLGAIQHGHVPWRSVLSVACVRLR